MLLSKVENDDSNRCCHQASRYKHLLRPQFSSAIHFYTLCRLPLWWGKVYCETDMTAAAGRITEYGRKVYKMPPASLSRENCWLLCRAKLVPVQSTSTRIVGYTRELKSTGFGAWTADPGDTCLTLQSKAGGNTMPQYSAWLAEYQLWRIINYMFSKNYLESSFIREWQLNCCDYRGICVLSNKYCAVVHSLYLKCAFATATVLLKLYSLNLLFYFKNYKFPQVYSVV